MLEAVAAPYFSGTDLTSAAPQPILSGVAANFNPENTNPLAPVQNTISQLSAQAQQNIEQKRQQVFQQQQQQRQFNQDIFAKAMDMDYQDKVRRYQQNIVDRDNLYKSGALNGFSAFNMKDPQTGADMSFAPLEADNQLLKGNADKLLQESAGNWTQKANDPDFQSRLRSQEQLKNLAQMRSVEVAKMRQALANAAPEDQPHIQSQIDDIVNTPLNTGERPDAYLPPPEMKAIIDPTAKGMPTRDDWEEGTDAQGNSVRYLPTSYYKSIQYSTDKPTLQQVSKNAKYIRSLPEATDPAAFTQWRDAVDKNWKARGEKTPLDIGHLENDGNGGLKVVLNPDNRVLATAAEVVHSGGLEQADESEAADLNLKKAQTAKDWADVNKIKKETDLKGQKPLTAEEIQLQESAANTVKRAKSLFDPARYEDQQAHPGTPMKEITVPGKKHWYGDEPDTKTYAKIEGVDIAKHLKEEGMNPADWVVYKAPAGIEEGVGKQKLGEGKDAKGQANGKQFKTGRDEPVDHSFMLYNPATKQVLASYFQNKPKDEHDLLNISDARDYVTNAPNGKHQWASTGKEATNLAYEKEYGQNLWDAQSGTNKSTTPVVTRPSSIPQTAELRKTTAGRSVWVDKQNRKIYDENGVEIKKGQ